LTHPPREHARVLPDDLNAKQRAIFDFIRDHSTVPFADRKPLNAMLKGTAGTGKSYVIHAIRSLLGTKCIVVAPTGSAASSIQGNTIHSKLAIPVHGFKELAADSLDDLHQAWKPVEYIIIDEISMVGLALLGMIDSRLRQIFPSCQATVYGGRSVLMCGDFGQLPPVMDKCLFSAASSHEALVIRGRLAYQQLNASFSLKTVVRQDDDAFRNVLLRLREGETTPEDWQLLSTRDPFHSNDGNEPRFQNCMHLFPTRLAVFQHNLSRLLQSTTPVAVFNALHPGGDRASKEASAQDACNLEVQLALCVGAPVMLLHNMWVDYGLVNGSVGTVKAIIYKEGIRPPQLPYCVFVHFPGYSGPTMKGDVVPILERTSHWMQDNHHCSRTQIPLTPSYGATIYKSQGLTLDTARVYFATDSRNPFSTYVALSRVRRLTDLTIVLVNYEHFKKIAASAVMAQRKAEDNRLEALNDP